MKRQNIPICISIVALAVSLISLWLSYQNREYDRLVAFEQRKQEVRQILLEGEILTEKIDKAVLEHVRTDETPELREDAAKIWERVRDERREMESLVAQVEALPATSGTADRLTLERIFVDVQRNNKKLLEQLELARQRHGVSHKEMRSPEDHNN